MTNFANDQGTGTVQADSFSGPQPAGNPNQSPLPAKLLSGFALGNPQALAAAGATQGAATLVTSMVAIATVSLTSEGVRMGVALTGLLRFLFNFGPATLRAYPALHGAIDAGASNVQIVIPAHKGVMFAAKGDGKTWVTIKGA